jgi:hypothetical protein
LPRVTESFRLTDVRRLDPGSWAGVTEYVVVRVKQTTFQFPARHPLQRSILSVILVSVAMICQPSALLGPSTLRHAGPDPASSHAKSFA